MRPGTLRVDGCAVFTALEALVAATSSADEAAARKPRRRKGKGSRGGGGGAGVGSREATSASSVLSALLAAASTNGLGVPPCSTALHFAAIARDAAVVQRLLSRRVGSSVAAPVTAALADVTAVDEKGHTPLMAAVSCAKDGEGEGEEEEGGALLDTVVELVKAGSALGHRDAEGNTVLHLAGASRGVRRCRSGRSVCSWRLGAFYLLLSVLFRLPMPLRLQATST